MAGSGEGVVDKGLERRWERKRESVMSVLGLRFRDRKRPRRGTRDLGLCAICYWQGWELAPSFTVDFRFRRHAH